MKYYKFNNNLRYVKLNLNMASCGKTYYEINKSWKELKKRIKQILDLPESCKETKILEIKLLLEDYESRYLKGNSKNEN